MSANLNIDVGMVVDVAAGMLDAVAVGVTVSSVEGSP